VISPEQSAGFQGGLERVVLEFLVHDIIDNELVCHISKNLGVSIA